VEPEITGGTTTPPPLEEGELVPTPIVDIFSGCTWLLALLMITFDESLFVPPLAASLLELITELATFVPELSRRRLATAAAAADEDAL